MKIQERLVGFLGDLYIPLSWKSGKDKLNIGQAGKWGEECLEMQRGQVM